MVNGYGIMRRWLFVRFIFFVAISSPAACQHIGVDQDSSLTNSSTQPDTLRMVSPDTRLWSSDTLDALLKAVDPLTIFPQLSSLGMITVPKGYVFILIGLLAAGGLMIFVADCLRPTRKKTGVVLKSRDDAGYAVRNFKTQSLFEGFVITLFDPLYFRHWKPKAERVYAGGHGSGKEAGPDFEFEFNYKELCARFAIKCHYYHDRTTGPVKLGRQRLQVLRDFEEGKETPLYYILGFGGAPDDPHELFLVPAKAITQESVSKAALRPYSKSGMFFYNPKLGLQ
jgi:hypothetical protein